MLLLLMWFVVCFVVCLIFELCAPRKPYSVAKNVPQLVENVNDPPPQAVEKYHTLNNIIVGNAQLIRALKDKQSAETDSVKKAKLLRQINSLELQSIKKGEEIDKLMEKYNFESIS